MFPKVGDTVQETKMKLNNVVEQFNSVAGKPVITLEDLIGPSSQTGNVVNKINSGGMPQGTFNNIQTNIPTGTEEEGDKFSFRSAIGIPTAHAEESNEGRVLGAENQGPQMVPGFREALQYAQQNPNDPNSQKLISGINSGIIDPNTGQKIGTKQQKTDTIGTLGKFGNALGSFFGGNKIGAAIGDKIGSTIAKYGAAGENFKNAIAMIEQQYREGKIDEAKRNKYLEMQEKAMRETFGYDGPGVKELIGDTAKAAINVFGGAELGGASFLANVGKAALWGAGYGAANAMSEDKKLNQIAKDALIGGTIAGAIPVAGKVAGKALRGLSGKNTATEALGEILQGKKKDLKAGQKVLSVINSKGVKTYEDLGARIDDLIDFSAKNVDDVLGQDKVISKLDDLVTITKTVGGKEIKSNYVEKALTQLEELYTKIGDDVSVANVQEIMQKAKTQGLTKVEINQIARKYGMEFGDKAFNKVGDALTSVNAQMYENVRKGVKEVARRGITGQAAKELDSLMSDAFTVRDLVKKNIEAVNKLDQKAVKMGVGENIIRWVTQAADTLSLGLTRGVRNVFIRSNVSKKTMNSFDVEQRLAKNLKILQKANNSKTVGEFQKYIRKLNRATLNKIKTMRPGLNIEATMNNEAIQHTIKRIEELKRRGLSPKNYQIKALEKQLKKLYLKKDSGAIRKTTNDLTQKVYVGRGGMADKMINGVDELGTGTYVAKDVETASKFGKVTELNVSLKPSDILKINSQKEFEEFTRKAIKKFPKLSVAEAKTAYAKSQGYKAIRASKEFDPLGGINIIDKSVFQSKK
jgi:hypothetical protein